MFEKCLSVSGPPQSVDGERWVEGRLPLPYAEVGTGENGGRRVSGQPDSWCFRL